MTELYRGCMRGRTMYVVPFCMGPLDAEQPHVRGGDHRLGVRRGVDADHDPDGRRRAGRMGDGRRLRAVPALGGRAAGSRASRTSPGRATTTKYIATSPRSGTIWSYGSGYGGNSLLGKKCYALRIASAHGPRRGLAGRAHADPQADLAASSSVHYIAAAFPSACGKTNLAMLRADPAGLEGRDPGRRHRLDAVRRGRPAVRAQPRVRLLRRRAGHRLGRPTPTPCAPSSAATRSSPTSR